MTIKEIYNLAIQKGIEADFRSKEEIEKMLKKIKEKYEKMESDEKEFFDQEKLTNPFSDTRILYGDPNKKVKKVLVGIDISAGELFLAEKFRNIDLIISHHPLGKALLGLPDVMHLQIDFLVQYGVPVNIAEKFLKKRIEKVIRRIIPENYNETVDLARHLDLPLISIHTPGDNLVAKFLKERFEKNKFFLLEDIIKSLQEIPEYREATRIGAGPMIFVGNKENRAGKIAPLAITGGTEGALEIYEKLAIAGIGTIIGMHLSEIHCEEVEKANINVVIAGHISSDSLGMNLFLDELERKNVEIVSCGGFTRVSRIEQ